MKESTIQQVIVNYLSRIAAENKFTFFSIPNEGFMRALESHAIQNKMSFQLLSQLKKMGLTPGMPDLCIIKKGKVFFLEVKNEKGRLNNIQKIIIDKLSFCGAKTFVVRSIRDTINKLNEWGIVDDN